MGCLHNDLLVLITLQISTWKWKQLMINNASNIPLAIEPSLVLYVTSSHSTLNQTTTDDHTHIIHLSKCIAKSEACIEMWIWEHQLFIKGWCFPNQWIFNNETAYYWFSYSILHFGNAFIQYTQTKIQRG